MNLVIYLIVINVIAFILCGIDKINAINNKYRIKETKLLSLAIAGGCFGLLFGMYVFHHKTRKMKFKIVYLLVIIWLFIIIYNVVNF